MTNDQQLIEALQATIKAQNLLIDYQKMEIERLKPSQSIVLPPFQPITNPNGTNPNLYINPSPFVPGSSPQSPLSPHLQPPYIITSMPNGGAITVPNNPQPPNGVLTVSSSGGSTNVALTGDVLTPGSVQAENEVHMSAGLMR